MNMYVTYISAVCMYNIFKQGVTSLRFENIPLHNKGPPSSSFHPVTLPPQSHPSIHLPSAPPSLLKGLVIFAPQLSLSYGAIS